MKLVATSEFFALFPDALIATVVARGVDNRASEAASARLRSAQDEALARLRGATLAEHPRIRCWREAYRAFGAKPKDHRSSIENLIRRALEGEPLRSVNPLVDLYNAISLSHFLPAGGEDLDAIRGDVFLTRAGPSEPPVKLLGEAEERPPKPGEVLYRDDLGAICRRWNWKEADRTKLTHETRNAVLVLEAIPPITRDQLEAAARELASLVEETCRGTTTTDLLDRDHPETSLREP